MIVKLEKTMVYDDNCIVKVHRKRPHSFVWELKYSLQL